MLNSISWQQYVTALLLLCAAWYLLIGLRYYRPELSARLKIKPGVKSDMPPVASKLTVVMGAAKPDADTGIYPAEELVFSSAEPDGIGDQTLPKGPSDDLLEEAGVLIDAYRENDDKNGFLSLFELLVNKYEVFQEEISLPAVIRQLRDKADSRLPFRLKESEWPSTF